MLLEHCLWPFRITYSSPCIAYDYLPFGVLNRQNAIANFIMVMGKVVVSIVIFYLGDGKWDQKRQPASVNEIGGYKTLVADHASPCVKNI